MVYRRGARCSGGFPYKMVTKIQFISLLSLLLIGAALRQDSRAHAQAPDDFLPTAVTLAQASQRETLVPTSVTLAQAILETDWGRRPIAGANNYFGIKASPRADGAINYGRVAVGWVWAWTKEWDGLQYIDVRARFRKYDSMADSFRDHGYLLSENPRYALALSYVDDPDEFARQIARAGYASAPDYAERLIQLMTKFDLYRHDLKRDDAQFLDQSDYPTVEPGERFTIYFEVQNAGLSRWRDGEGYALVNVNAVPLGADKRQPLENEVPPAAVKRWNLNLSAPLTPGKYRTRWMLAHGDKTFGPEMYIEVTVAAGTQARDQVVLQLLAAAALLLVLGVGLVGMCLVTNNARFAVGGTSTRKLLGRIVISTGVMPSGSPSTCTGKPLARIWIARAR